MKRCALNDAKYNFLVKIAIISKKVSIFAVDINVWCMLILQDCLYKLAGFKKDFGSKFGIVKLGIPCAFS